MNYDQIILELLSRIKTLEEKVAILESKETFVSQSIRNNLKEEISGGHRYRALSAYLKNSNLDRIKMSFSEIENIIGFSLSPSAYKNRANWANSTSQSLACSWLKVGYKTVEVNITAMYVVFEKE